MGSPVKMIKDLLLRSFIRTLNRILLILLETLNDPTVPLALMPLFFSWMIIPDLVSGEMQLWHNCCN